MKKRSAVTPQIRTRKLLAEQGYLVATVEQQKRWRDPDKQKCEACGNEPMIVIKSDLFGAFDVIGFHPGNGGVILVQTTTGDHHAARKLKVLACLEAKIILMAGVRILVQSWTQDVDDRWQHRDEFITMKDFRQAPNYPTDVRTLLELRRKERRPDLPPGTTLKFNPIRDEEVPF